MKPSAVIITALLVALALTGFIFVRVEAGAGDSFVIAQRGALRLTAAGVDQVVRTAPESRGGPRGLRAACIPQSQVGLRNPWHCVISYPGGVKAQYTVHIRLNGSYTGADQVVDRNGQVSRGAAQITGCCVVVP